MAIADFTSQDRFDVRVQRPLAIELAPFLEREIITRRLEPGEKLVELDLCARFGVSRSPMREALRLLEASLLVTRRPRYGVRVAPMTLENLNHVYACRAPLEALGAGGGRCTRRLVEEDAGRRGGRQCRGLFFRQCRADGRAARPVSQPVLIALLARRRR